VRVVTAREMDKRDRFY